MSNSGAGFNFVKINMTDKEDIKIIDESGDREFFTIIPNYILNHSTHTIQALYLQMKRYAGEDGRCFATQKTLMNKLGIGRQIYNKSLNYLIKTGWIEFVGMTNGKTRPIKTYKINNIWQENSDYYKKIVSRTAVSSKKEIVSETIGDSVQNSSKIVSRTAIEEDPTLSKIQEEELSKHSLHISETINLFKDINPSYNRLFANKTERSAIERLIKTYGKEKLEGMIKSLKDIISMPYAPRITTPYKLETKMGELIAFMAQKRGENKTIKSL